jgi:hypothetical protein
MKLAICGWLLALGIFIAGSTSTVAQSRIQLVQGRRVVNDKITFIVDVSREKSGSPRYATAPEDIRIFTRFADRPASGMVYIDGKALGRFDESMSFYSNAFDITYGRHTMTLAVTSPAVVFDFTVDVRGGRAHEVIKSEEAVTPKPLLLEQRVFGLERRVHELEAEIATLKKNRVQ